MCAERSSNLVGLMFGWCIGDLVSGMAVNCVLCWMDTDVGFGVSDGRVLVRCCMFGRVRGGILW